MAKAPVFPTVPFLRRQPNLGEIEVLMDLLPQAALLLDLRARRVLLANAGATALTAYTRSELVSQELVSLLPCFADGSLAPASLGIAEPIQAVLSARNGTFLEVLLTLIKLDKSGLWALVTLEPLAAYQRQQAERKREARRWEDLQGLAQAVQESDEAVALETALEAGRRMTGTSLLAIYLVASDSPGLQRTAGCGPIEHLPESIPAAEVDQLLEGKCWITGKRASTALLRAARAARLAYLASAPLGQPGALVGVLVCAAADGSPAEDLLPLMEMLAATLTAAIQQQAFKTNLLLEQGVTLRALAIAEAMKEFSLEGAIVLTRDLAIEMMNPAAELMLGYATQEVRGLAFGNVLIGADNLVPALQSAQQGIPTLNLGNVRLHRRDGGVFLAHLRTIPVIFADQLIAVLVLLRDLSEREQFEVRNEQLEQRAMLGEVTAIFAHEVRNPINNISTGLQLMAYNLPEDDPNQEVLSRLSQDCNRLAHLMQSVLAFSRPPENKLEPVDLNTLLPAMVDRWRPRLVRLKVQHKVKSTAPKATITGDVRALEQVFNNLIGNAVQAMSDTGGNLTINIRPVAGNGDRPRVEVSISDDGPGIPDEIIDRIFEPFFTTNRNGTGLGLAIAKRIVSKHKGTIKVSSVPGGTVFQVILPLSDGAESHEPEHPDR